MRMPEYLLLGYMTQLLQERDDIEGLGFNPVPQSNPAVRPPFQGQSTEGLSDSLEYGLSDPV
jgi:hypothetical protein